jgi:hypothetical protein
MHSSEHRDLENSWRLGWDLSLEVARPRNSDSIVLQHLDITLDCRALEYDRITVQELP